MATPQKESFRASWVCVFLECAGPYSEGIHYQRSSIFSERNKHTHPYTCSLRSLSTSCSGALVVVVAIGRKTQLWQVVNNRNKLIARRREVFFFKEDYLRKEPTFPCG